MNKRENEERFVCLDESTVESNLNRKVFFENKISSLDRILTTKETAEYLRSTPKQIRKWVYQGKIKAYKLCGKSLRFKKVELDLLLKGGQSWG